MSRRTLALRVAVLSLLAAGPAACTDGNDRPEPPEAASTGITTQSAPPSRTTPFSNPQQRFALYEPPAEEQYANGKRLAGRVAQRLATFRPLAGARELASSVGAVGQRAAELQRIVGPLLDPARRSAGEVVYVQLSGVTATTLGAMVVVRQHLEDGAGTRQLVVRVMDVRLRRTDGPWSLDRVASVGGTAVPRPASVSPAAARVLDHPNIQLPDTARWDIHRGGIDDGLLRALGDAADRWPFAVSVLRTGHPPNVWAAGRPSAHAAGSAADIYAVAGTLVVRQRMKESSARQLAAAFLAAGAAQVGSPWTLPPGGRRSFADRVHWDHIHVQQTRSSERRR
jgi:hypothetical protein